MLVRCEKNGANYGPRFLDGKVYQATHFKNALWSIRDEAGYERYIIPGEPCPHLSVNYRDGRSVSVGRWVPIEAAP